MSRKQTWYEDGIRWTCQGSGKCCVSRGAHGFVYMTLDDRKRMANVLKMKTSAFTKTYCDKTDGYYHLKLGDQPECIFLEDNKCSVYKGRPMQCRTWPFWPENMKAKNWKADVVGFCPGVDKGQKVYTPKEIKKIVEEQLASEI